MFPIIKNRMIWFGFSTIITIVSVILIAFGGLRLGIDFTGGTLIEIAFTDKISMDDFSNTFTSSLGERGEQIVQTEEGFIVRSREISAIDQDTLFDALTADGKAFEVKRATSIGPTVGNTFKKTALMAILVTIIAIVLYIAFAFRRVPRQISPWKFGLATVVALVHDVVVTAGVFALLGFTSGVEVDGLFVTALLTVLGFSVHDTIVVFDRLRENLKGKTSEKFADVAEKALWQTMVRSINTSMSTLIVLTVLMIFGSPTLFYFLLALIVGISIGTYSSIFLATPLLVSWQKK